MALYESFQKMKYLVDKTVWKKKDLRFSVRSLEKSATLVNASGATNFTYLIKNKVLTEIEILQIHNEKKFSNKINLINQSGAFLEFEKVENQILSSNLQTIDYNFGKILSEVILHFYTNDISSENTVAKFIEKVTHNNTNRL
ncbi:HpaII family restriction endonuclease [Flavobacterium franklandianum]|uniref:HpaII family restriction endonuclease n=2 Tax=Flavobacterium franklandianum TaxID=2594430 RepID=A0A553C5Y4_9FLAO|nr:HpaII family restriction endonuclease [Flavobacterium franklandianum]